MKMTKRDTFYMRLIWTIALLSVLILPALSCITDADSRDDIFQSGYIYE